MFRKIGFLCVFGFVFLLMSCSSMSTLLPYSVDGIVLLENGQGLNEVVLEFANGFGTTQTDVNGTWSKAGLHGDVVITPKKEGYSFNPEKYIVDATMSDIYFQAIDTNKPYTVNGIVVDSEEHELSGVTLSFDNGSDSVTTDTTGTWMKSGLVGIVTITPEKNGYKFEPASIQVKEETTDIRIVGSDNDVYEADTTWGDNIVLGQEGDYSFAGIYKYENLTIGDNVEVTSTSISQLVIKVKGTLTLGKNAVIRVRNGCYSDAPESPVSNLTAYTLDTFGEEASGFRVYANMFGRGGDGGRGGNGQNTTYAGSGGGGGGGGYGGGLAGSGGAAGYGSGYQGSKGDDGSSNGGSGGDCMGGSGGRGGYATNVGRSGTNGSFGGNGGGGGGGNGGDGGDAKEHYLTGEGGGGGGGGGYGGGILTIIADNIIFDEDNPPKFLVSGQQGGSGGGVGPAGADGDNGQGGLLIIQCPNYQPDSAHWNLGWHTYGNHVVPSSNGGHGVITGNPQKVFVNGVEQEEEEEGGYIS